MGTVCLGFRGNQLARQPYTDGSLPAQMKLRAQNRQRLDAGRRSKRAQYVVVWPAGCLEQVGPYVYEHSFSALALWMEEQGQQLGQICRGMVDRDRHFFSGIPALGRLF